MVSSCYNRSMDTPCTVCGQPADLSNRHQRYQLKTTGRAYCSRACSTEYRRRVSSATMAKTNRVHASERMTRNNPMHDDETRERMAATLRRVKHRPKVRGGNGHPITEPQRVLAEMLGWPTEVSIAPSDGMRPYHYKADIAHPTMKVCVEVDGGSHQARDRQEQDQRRDARLAACGWITLRFSNRAAMERTAECAEAVWSTTSRWTPRTPTQSGTA